MKPTKIIRCAIYTRKSTDEGLDQAFNSLDAQREACSAYVLSQAGEGWLLLPNRYDDGGYSGGNMDRPGLTKLLADVDAGRVDVVVVYKIDRLTRALSDFAKIVDRLDKRSASFVSVTQSFNTTTSMGRLTLNVLLSFAQFEREVGAERVRDKIAASRKKGIFMGGNPPLGYDIDHRKLILNAAEAETVRFIFTRFLSHGSVTHLRDELTAKGIRSKRWTSRAGLAIGGRPFGIGQLYSILKNKVYVGLATHKGQAYPGEHAAIVDLDTFDAVQAVLMSNTRRTKTRRRQTSPSLLTGKIRDATGRRMSPTFTQAAPGWRHGYYLSQSVLKLEPKDPSILRRVRQDEIDPLVTGRVTALVRSLASDGSPPSGRLDPVEMADRAHDSASPALDLSRDEIRAAVSSVCLSWDHAILDLEPDVLLRLAGLDGPLRDDPAPPEAGHTFHPLLARLRACLPPGDTLILHENHLRLTIPVTIRPRRRRVSIDSAPHDWTRTKVQSDPALLRAVARGLQWRNLIEAGEITSMDALAIHAKTDRKSARQILRLAFLAPDILGLIAHGRQPAHVTLKSLIQGDLPISWTEQRTTLFGHSS